MQDYEQIERNLDAGPHAAVRKAANQLRNNLTPTLAHELRSPLASILTALSALRDSCIDEATARQARERAERQAWHMARIIEDVLDICRGSQGKLSLRKERVGLTAVTAGAIEIAGTFLTARGHHLTVSLPPERATLVVDRTRLTQILTNLLTNAAKYTDPGGEIGLAAEAEAGGVVFRVRDNGRGIAPDLSARVFELFQQGDGPDNQGSGGLGIGLALVKSLVELHGGNVAVVSHGPGTGSEFIVRLPDCDLKVEEEPPTSDRGEARRRGLPKKRPPPMGIARGHSDDLTKGAHSQDRLERQ
jgi:signal transduction histidine kinase